MFRWVREDYSTTYLLLYNFAFTAVLLDVLLALLRLVLGKSREEFEKDNYLLNKKCFRGMVSY